MQLIRQQKQINSIVKKACQELKIDYTEVHYNTDNDICFEYDSSKNINKISIDYVRLIQIIKIKNNCTLWHFFKLNSISKRLKFVLYHEVGHYLQCKKRKAHFIRECRIHDWKILSPENYRKQKLEKQADKIALGLLKRGIA